MNNCSCFNKKSWMHENIERREYPLNEKLDQNISAAMMKVVNTIYNMEEA